MKIVLFYFFIILMPAALLWAEEIPTSAALVIESPSAASMGEGFNLGAGSFGGGHFQPGSPQKMKPSPGTSSSLINGTPSLLSPPAPIGDMGSMGGIGMEMGGGLGSSFGSLGGMAPSSESMGGKKDNDLVPALREMDKAVLSNKMSSATERARFYYENKVAADESCVHCPEYLKLIGAVNDIVERVGQPQSIEAQNEQLLQLDRLKFMYIERVGSLKNGEECEIMDGGQEGFKVDGLNRDHLSLLFEEMIDLPSITAIQFYPAPPQKEVRYVYRGEGQQSHLLIEVSVKADKSATIRYYQYEDPQAPELGSDLSPKRQMALVEGEQSFNNLKTDATINFSHQSIGANLSTDQNDWLVVRANHRPQEQADFSAMIPLKVKLPGDSGNELLGSYSQEHRQDLVMDSHTKTEEAKLAIINPNKGEVLNARIYQSDNSEELSVVGKFGKDINDKIQVRGAIAHSDTKNEYIRNTQNTAEVAIGDIQGKHEFIHAKYEDGTHSDLLYLKSKHRLELNQESGLNVEVAAAQQSVRTDFDKKDQNEYILSLTNYRQEYVTVRVAEGDDLDRLIALSSRYTTENRGSFQVGIDQYDSGQNTVSFGHQLQKGKNSFATTIGHDSERKTFINFNAQRAISSTASMMIEVKTDSLNKTTMMYQYQNKF